VQDVAKFIDCPAAHEATAACSSIQLFIRAINVSAIVAGVSATAIPAAFNASIFPEAVPLPPETIAPACPIRRPGGAVIPAINPATGFLQFVLIHSAASSSAEPPI